uniref:Cuticle protein n=1 Tax=Heliothis virescens TaxID=7102 RepID=A0A2A4K4Z5_HELVI
MSHINQSLRGINVKMMRKILLMLCSSAIVSAGVIGSDYSPSTSISYASIATPIVKTVSTTADAKTVANPIGYTKIVQSPPVYHTILTTKERNYESPDGTQHTTTYTKTLDTNYSTLKKYDSKSTKDGDVVANTIPGIYSTAVHSPIVYHQGTAYTLSSPVVHTIQDSSLTKSVPVPVAYTTHDVPLTKTIVTPSVTSYSTPVFEKSNYVATGLSSYSSHSPVESRPIKTTVTYSEAPLVSHMSFTGLGASYAW